MRRGSLAGFGGDADLGDPEFSDLIQDEDHFVEIGPGVGVQRELGIRVRGLDRGEAKWELAHRHLFLVDIDIPALRHGNGGDAVVLLLGLGGAGTWKHDRYPLVLDHGKGNHHEGGEKEEHDVDQGNDLDPGFFSPASGDSSASACHFAYAFPVEGPLDLGLKRERRFKPNFPTARFFAGIAGLA